MDKLNFTNKVQDCYDVIVVGAGIMGSATAYTLTKEGKKCLLLEQFLLPHTRGSSHGATRTTRSTYLESFNARIMPAAFEMWKQLEKESNTTLFRRAGVLTFSRNSHDDVRLYQSNIQKISSDSTMYDDKHGKLLTHDMLEQSFPLLRTTADDIACYEHSAGTLFADKCLQAFQNVYSNFGGVIHDNERVTAIAPGNPTIVKTDKATYYTRGVVLTCGSWAGTMLGNIGVHIPLKCEAIQVCYWKSQPNYDHSKMSCFFYIDEEIYGVPSNEYPGLMKICRHGGVPCDPDRRDQVDTKQEAEQLAHLKEFIMKRFPYLIPEPAIKERCIYTITPDEQCVIGSHSTYKNIVYAAGFSGHGFKMAPVIGSMLADLVQQRKPKHHVEEFNAERFTRTSRL